MGRPDERLRVFDVDPETGHYRRFFDIDDLAGVRVEDPEVFELTHDKVLALRRATASSTGCASTTPTASPTRPATCERLRDAGAAHVWVEKILHPGEALRDWPVERDRRLRVPQRRAGRCSSTRPARRR